MLILYQSIYDLYRYDIAGITLVTVYKWRLPESNYWFSSNTNLIAWLFVIIILCVIIIVSNNKRLRYQKRVFQKAQLATQKNLLLAIIEAEERERKRIGMDLHDEVGSLLSLLRLMIENIYSNLTESYVEQCKLIIDKIVNNVRAITYNLSPFVNETYNFNDALEDLCDSINQLNTISIILDDHTYGKLDLIKSNTAISLFRVLSELVNNTIKHSKANRINLKLLLNQGLLVIDYADNGIGISETNDKKKGTGMLNIESRLNAIGADYYHRSRPDSGFNITITVNI